MAKPARVSTAHGEWIMQELLGFIGGVIGYTLCAILWAVYRHYKPIVLHRTITHS